MLRAWLRRVFLKRKNTAEFFTALEELDLNSRKPAYKLVIVESPAKARTISKFLGRSYKVEASRRARSDLPKSQLGVDVEHNFEPKYITIRGRGEVLSASAKEAKGRENPSFSRRTLTARGSDFVASGDDSGHRPGKRLPRGI